MAEPPRWKRSLGLADLVLFNISAVTGIRWLAAAAHAGPVSIPLWIAAAVLFFVPVSLAVGSLSRRFPLQGGLYVWTRHAFGDWHAFLCGYCYWLNNLFYLPSLALAGAAMAGAILGDPCGSVCPHALPAALAAIAVFTLINMAGLSAGKWIGNAGATATALAAVVLAASALRVASIRPPATDFSAVPSIGLDRLNFWSQIAFAFGGVELSAVVSEEIRDPQRSIPRAAWLSAAVISFVYIGGTAALLALLAPEQISPVTGLVQGAQAAATALGSSWLLPLVAVLVTAGIAGQLGSWIAGCSRIPSVLGMDHLLPASFARLHSRFQSPVLALAVQAAVSCLFLLALHAGESLKSGYQLLVDMAVITYFIPFAYLFLADWKFGARIRAASGFGVTVLAILFSMIPPAGVPSPLLFVLKLAGGAALVLGFARYWFVRRTRFLSSA